MKRFVITDIHGNFKAFEQCLEKSGFNKEIDKLFILGDVVDSWPDSKLCVDLVLSIKNHKYILGNHDMWFGDYIKSNCNIITASQVWLSHGGEATIESYKEGIPESHKKLFLESAYYHVTEDNKLMIHAGFKPGQPLNPKNYLYYTMNRDLVDTAIDLFKKGIKYHISDYSEVYVGHTPTIYDFDEPNPIIIGNLHMLDTGAGFNGKLTIMDIDTKEYWQSDPVMDLYPDHRGRNVYSKNEMLSKLGLI